MAPNGTGRLEDGLRQASDALALAIYLDGDTYGAEALAQAVAASVEFVVSALDVNALLDEVDLNAVLDRVDINRCWTGPTWTACSGGWTSQR